MPKLFYCPTFEQSEEKGASASLRDSCKRCGRTKRAHREQTLPANERAKDWLEKAGYKNSSFYHLAENLLTTYILWEDSFR